MRLPGHHPSFPRRRESSQNTHTAKQVILATLNFKLVWIPAYAGMTELRVEFL